MPDRGQFSTEQREVLLRPIVASRVSRANGMSHVEAYDILAHLNRLFGFEGWDKEILSCECLFEDHVKWADKKTGEQKSGWDVAYKANMRLTVYAMAGGVACVKEDVSVGDAAHQPSRADAHDLAMKSAVSTALKRCAKDLGDGFGLSLYDKGSTDALVKRVVPYGPPGAYLPIGVGEREALMERGVIDPPLPPDTTSTALASRQQQTKLRAKLHEIGINENDDVHTWCTTKLGRPVDSLNAITAAEARTLIDSVTT